MADVKLLESQRLTDNSDGGGLATANEVVDGAVNNVFDDISRIDRVNGDVSLRKVFAQATDATTETYSGLHLIVAEPPADPRVSTVLFETGSWADERSDARSFVERYLDESVITRMIPYDRQLAGQRSLLVYQRPELRLPEIGEVYVLKNDTTGLTEFVRVSDVDHQVETFTDVDGNFPVRVITMTLSQPLTQEFAGSQPNRYFRIDTGASVLRSSIVGDAARYKGVAPLAEDANVGDVAIKVGTVFGQLVPATTSEVGILDAEPAGEVRILPAGNAAIARAVQPLSLDGTKTIYSPRALRAGAVVLQLIFRATGANPAVTATSNEDGSWSYTGNGSVVITAMDEEAGTVTLTQAFFNGLNDYDYVLTSTPHVAMPGSPLSFQQPVTISTRGYVYLATLRPTPVPGTLTVSFRALGKWYELRDDGTGALVGETGVGSGLVNFATGSVSVTLGALPDIGSSVIFAWGGDSAVEIRAGDLDIEPPRVEINLSSGNCEPGSLAIGWTSGGIARTAGDDGAGSITGDATGRIVYSTGQVVLVPTLLPDADTQFTVDYDSGDAPDMELFHPDAVGGFVTVTVAGAPIRPGSVLLAHAVQFDGNNGLPGSGDYGIPRLTTATWQLVDDGQGQLRYLDGTVRTGSSVNYATGEIVFPIGFTRRTAVLTYDAFENPTPSRLADAITNQYTPTNRFGKWPIGVGAWEKGFTYVNGSPVTVQFKRDVVVDTARNEVTPAPALSIDLTVEKPGAIVPGSLLLTFGGRTYIDRGGTLYYGVSASTSAGTVGGTIDYATGRATITGWQPGSASAITVGAMLVELSPLPLATVHARTPGSPLRPGSFTVVAVRDSDSAAISGVADTNGNISSPEMHGYVDVTTGVFSIAFGGYVLDAGLTVDEKAEPWYSAGAVDADGYIWRPGPIVPGSLKFNCVIQSALPLDPDIIGINPVRLPMDGRVQVFRAGDTVVIHDTQAETLPDNLSAGQVCALPRGGLATVVLYDQEGAAVDPALFTSDLEVGSVAMADPLDLSAYMQPLVASHRIEDMALCTDAQITGHLSLAQALSHGYTAANSLVSSALVLGDVQGRYERLFAQNTWTNVWSDELIGSAPTSGAQYNDVTYPIQVLNRDAITQRWRLAFTSSTVFNIVSEELGIIGTGSTATGAAPLNPETGQPYFIMPAAGFGAGWATGNQIRFNTVAAGAPVWIARVVKSGPATEQDDQTKLLVRWDKD